MRHPLDPGTDGSCVDGCFWHKDVLTVDDVPNHCHCDYHDGSHGCRWGNTEFIRRLLVALEKARPFELRA